MAHIRQVLANLSISVSEFKKSPKTVIKAVKNEPIAVIINDKPAFYCVPADILESLYQKFYEMNDMSLQNMQDINASLESDDLVVDDDEDSTFGVNDIFQSIEDEQQAKLSSSQDIVDPLSPQVSDPLDEEVAYQLNSSIDKHLMDSAKQVSSVHTNRSMNEFDDLDDIDDLNDIDEHMSDLDIADFNSIGDLSDIDGVRKNARASMARKRGMKMSDDGTDYNASADPMLNPGSYQKSMDELHDLSEGLDKDDKKVKSLLKKHGKKHHHDLEDEEPASVLQDPKISFKSYDDAPIKNKHKHHLHFDDVFDGVDEYDLKDFNKLDHDKESERLNALAHVEELERLASLKEEALARLNQGASNKNIFSDSASKSLKPSLMKNLSASGAALDAANNKALNMQSGAAVALNGYNSQSLKDGDPFTSKLKQIKKSSTDLKDILNSYNLKKTGDTKGIASPLEALKKDKGTTSIMSELVEAGTKSKKKSHKNEDGSHKHSKSADGLDKGESKHDHKAAKSAKKRAKAESKLEAEAQSIVESFTKAKSTKAKSGTKEKSSALEEASSKEALNANATIEETGHTAEDAQLTHGSAFTSTANLGSDIALSEASSQKATPLNGVDPSEYGDLSNADQSELLGELCGAGVLDGKLAVPVKKAKKSKKSKKESDEFESAPLDEIKVENIKSKHDHSDKSDIDAVLEAEASLETNSASLSTEDELEADGEIQTILEHIMSKSTTAWHEGDLSLDKYQGKKTSKKQKTESKKSDSKKSETKKLKKDKLASYEAKSIAKAEI